MYSFFLQLSRLLSLIMGIFVLLTCSFIYKFLCILKINNEFNRKILINNSCKILKKSLNYTFDKKIIITGKKLILTNKISVLNSNHIHNLDWLFILYLVLNNNIEGKQISSLSTDDGISLCDYSVLNLLESIIVGKDNSFIEYFNKKYTCLKKKKYKSVIFCFFEGVAKNNKKFKENDPKNLSFELFIYFKALEYSGLDTILFSKNCLNVCSVK